MTDEWTIADVETLVLDAWGEVEPNWRPLCLLGLLREAINCLREAVKADTVPWEDPFVELRYGTERTPDAALKHAEAAALAQDLAAHGEDFIWGAFLREMAPPGIICRLVNDTHYEVSLSPEREYEVLGRPEPEHEEKLAELIEGYVLPELTVAGSDIEHVGNIKAALHVAIRPLHVDDEGYFIPVQAGLIFEEGAPDTWSKEDRETVFETILRILWDEVGKLLRKWGATEAPKADPPDRVQSIHPNTFPVAGGYVRPIYGLSKRQDDRQLIMEFLALQTPLNWAVGLAMFSLTDEDRVRSGSFQEATITDIVDRVYCLTDRGVPIRGDHREDILAEVVKLHTTHNWYYELSTVQVGRAWTTRVAIGSQYAIPELQLVFLDTKTGDRVFPADAALRALRTPLEVKGRRKQLPDGKNIWALPKNRWKLESIRWRWVQSFNDDLLLTPDLVESGRRKGLPKKTVTGKTIRKGYLVKVATNIFNALRILRAEGGRSMYACRLLVMLAHNINKTESGIAADRVFRMLGIPENQTTKARGKTTPEDLVAAAVLRLKERDIGALLAGSDEHPREDRNRDRRRNPYYRFIRSPEFAPRAGLTSKEDALAVEAEYAESDTIKAKAPPAVDQAALPGLEAPPAPPLPSGVEIRAARETAGMNLRGFARSMGGPTHNTWAKYERGETVRTRTIKPEVWQRVRDFIAEHGPKADTDHADAKGQGE